MWNNLLNYIRSEEDQDPGFIRLTRSILIFVIITNILILPLVAGIAGGDSRNIVTFLILITALTFEVLSLVYLARGNILFAKITIPFGLVIAISVIAYNANGLRDTAFFAMPVILIVSAILLGRRSLLVITPIAVLATAIISVRDMAEGIDPRPIGLDDAIIVPILLTGSAVITHLLITRLGESTIRARESEEAQRKENAELNALRGTLEKRVQDRTLELETANRSAEKRARQFQAVAKVTSAISSVQKLDALLPLVSRLISEQFNVYHTGIFLLDAPKEYAVLRASNSEGGQRMLARNHKLPIGQTGIVGFVSATGQPRIALDVGADSVYFDNPDLPGTRSEIALPLRYAGEIIGALDVQSNDANAFTEEDIEVLSTLADQVSVAINNSRTIQEAEEALEEARSAVGNLAQESWQVLRPKQLGLGFEYSEAGIQPLQTPIDNPQINEALSKGKTQIATATDEPSRIAIPIRLRGRVIGVMQLNSSGTRRLTNDDADIAQAVAERLSLAIETATLLQSTQHRADLEKVTANITGKVGSSSRFETILQTAAQELSRALGGSDVVVQIEPAALKMYS